MIKQYKKLILIFFPIAFVLGALALYAIHWSLRATSSDEFCVSCHSMDVPHQEWQASVHYSNAKGIRAGCADCHIPHNNDWAYFKKKATSGIKDLFLEMTGQGFDTPEEFEAHRGEMAKVVWAEMKANDSVTCRSCHNIEAWDVWAQSDKARAEHKLMQEEGSTCIDCHRGIAHYPPEFAESADAAAEKLNTFVAQTPEDASTLYPIVQAPLVNGGGEGKQIGRVFPGFRLEVLSKADNLREVKLSGYQQEGAEQVIYAESGKRIIGAVLAKTELDDLTIEGEYTEDEISHSHWRPVSYVAWVDKEQLLANVDDLWNYGKELNNAYCGGCHAVIPGEKHTANQWPAIVEGMVGRTSLNDTQQLILTYYLQYNASDMIGGNTHE